jgi:hypothetical protein
LYHCRKITDQSGNAATDFNGTIYPVVYDKVQDQLTLANDPTSQAVNFKVQKNLLFKGKAKVQNGRFNSALFPGISTINSEMVRSAVRRERYP